MSEEKKNLSREENQLGFDIEDVDFEDIDHNEKAEVKQEKKPETEKKPQSVKKPETIKKPQPVKKPETIKKPETVKNLDSAKKADPAKRSSQENWPEMKTGKQGEKGIGEKSLDIPAFERRHNRPETEKNLAPRTPRRKKTFLEEYGRYLILGAVAVVLVIVLVTAGVKLFKKDTPDTESSSSGEQYVEENHSSSEERVDTSLQKEVVPALNTLMNTYYDSLIACDLDTIHSLVEDDSTYTMEKLEKQRDYIEDYLNVTCYTKPGLNEGEYVLYVYSEIKFANISTPAPQLNHYYVNQPTAGQYQLANGMLDNDKVEYMNAVDDDDDVLALIDEVYQKLNAAMESDETLNSLVQMLNNVPETTEPETTSAAEPSTSAPTQGQSGDSETFYVNGELFYRVNETVYPKEEVRVRATNSMDSDVVGVLTINDYVTRTGYSENWSQIIYNGYTAYVYKGFLTTNKPAN